MIPFWGMIHLRYNIPKVLHIQLNPSHQHEGWLAYAYPVFRGVLTIIARDFANGWIGTDCNSRTIGYNHPHHRKERNRFTGRKTRPETKKSKEEGNRFSPMCLNLPKSSCLMPAVKNTWRSECCCFLEYMPDCCSEEYYKKNRKRKGKCINISSDY